MSNTAGSVKLNWYVFVSLENDSWLNPVNPDRTPRLVAVGKVRSSSGSSTSRREGVLLGRWDLATGRRERNGDDKEWRSFMTTFLPCALNRIATEGKQTPAARKASARDSLVPGHATTSARC
jgi:hypothetical protein